MKTPRLFFLGAPKIELAKQPLALNAKAVALLAYLAVNHDPQPRERILGLLWADSTSDAARKNLRNGLWMIRKTLGDDAITSDDDHLALGTTVWADVREFESLFDLRSANSALAPAPEPKSEILKHTSKIELYRAPLLDGFSLPDASDFEIWLTTERERLAQTHLRALDALGKAQAARGDWHAVIETARRALAHDNLQEPMYRALMRAHAQLGDRSAAMREYNTLRAMLDRELDVTPLPETEALREAIVKDNLGETRVASIAPPQSRAAPANPTPFVGRTTERAALDEEFATAQNGHARIALLVGELGIGKSRLWREWSHTQSGTTLLETRCLASTQALPFAPVLALLNRRSIMAQLCARASAVSPIWLAQIARLLPEIRATLPNLPLLAPLPADEERQRIFEAFAQCLLALGTPLGFFVDDAHWADRATLDWLDYLAHRLRDQRILIGIAYRAEDAPAALIHLVAGWGREDLARRIPLARLTPTESARLIESLGGDPGIAARAQTQSAGNPYFLIELLRAGSSDIPVVLNDLIRARIDALPEAARQVAQAAAILEPDFDFATLRRTSGRDEEETLDALDALLNANVLGERETHYEFSHPLVATIVREGLSGARRAFLHRRAAEALEATQVARLPQIAGRLAAHYAQAGAAPRAAHYAELAADRALTLTSPAEAIDFYRQALALEPTSARHLGLGKALLQSGNLAVAHAAFENALRGFESAGDRAGAARACLNLAEACYPAGRFDEGQAWMQKGLAFLGNVNDPEGHALAHLMLASNPLATGNLSAQAVAHAQEAARIATAQGLSALAARAHFILGNLRAQQGDLAQAIPAFLESVRLAQSIGDDYQQVLGYNNAAYHALLAGDLNAAHAHLAQGFALAQARALKLPWQYLYSTRGEIALAEKNWDEAEQWFARGLTESQAHDNREQSANYHANRALAARGRGDLDAALMLFEQAREQAAALNAAHLQIQIELWLAEVYWERGEGTAAREALARGEARLQGGVREELIAWAKRLRAQFAAAQGQSRNR